MEGDTRRRLEDLPRPSDDQRRGSSVVPGSTRGSSVLGECGLAQERILRFRVRIRWWRRGDSNS
jgi:hypothetical protein